jgi:hypothetical protein
VDKPQQAQLAGAREQRLMEWLITGIGLAVVVIVALLWARRRR